MKGTYLRIIFFILSFLFYKSAHSKESGLSIVLVKCENKVNPLGTALENIHFSWQMHSTENNQLQKAYQVVVASSKQFLISGNYDVWNTGKVLSGKSILVTYKGKKLQAGKTYYWRVRVWDKNNLQSGWSEEATFTTGLFEAKDWSNAKWIGYDELPDSMKLVPGVERFNEIGNKYLQRSIVPLVRKGFNVTKKIKQAIAFVTGVGQYEMSINGEKVSNSFLSPGWTYYDKRILYNVYDVTDLLKIGENAIGVIVGNGFYNINYERYVKLLVAFGFSKMICKVTVDYEDGTSEIIISDDTWKTSASPITFSSIYGGEDYDARLEQTGWNQPGFNDAHWKTALNVQMPKGELFPEADYPLQVMDTINIKKVYRLKNDSFLFDFGQNASGIIELQVKGNKGDTIKLIPSELIDDKKMPNQNASGKPYYYTYTLRGGDVETWRPKFSYYGFRYVFVEGGSPDSANDGSLPSIINLTLLHTRNSAPATGLFRCSNNLFNQINELIQWAIKSNLQSVVTDCPHREKLGWLEQDYLMGTSIQYNFDIQLLYKKIVHDMMDAQTLNGLVPDIAPEFVTFSYGFRDSPEWGSAAVILPWLLYKWYGDKETMHDVFMMMKKYVVYLKNKSDNQILSYGLGDWYDYGPALPGEAQLTPKALTATAIYYYDISLLAKMAQLLHKNEDAIKFNHQANNIKKAFNQRFFNAQKKVYATGSQTAMAMPLCVGLVDAPNKTAVLKNLVDSIYKSNKALTAGDIGFHFLIEALDEGGASQLIYEMNNRDDVAGYGYQLKKGATSLTEAWNAFEESSNNHLMLGHIMEWFYSGLAGISQEDSSAAFKHIKIRPEPVGDITSAKGNFNSPYGWVISEWKKENGIFKLNIEIPVNADATVYLPAGATSKISVNSEDVKNSMQVKWIGYKDKKAVMKVGSGKYIFKVTE